MKTAIIGYTGFVGSNIANQYKFSDHFNTSNIKDIENKKYDLVVCAANRSEMWRINKDGQKDLDEIKEFINYISKVDIKKLVLISTVGVYKNPNEVDEDTPINTEGLSPYGTNRYFLENYISNNFDSVILRLPGLFGKGLKKNVIYDFLNDNNLANIHYKSTYQYYNLEHIWQDTEIALEHNLKLVNMSIEPLSTDEMLKYCFNINNFKNQPNGIKPAYFNMYSKYSKLFGGSGHYMYSKKQILREILDFVKDNK